MLPDADARPPFDTAPGRARLGEVLVATGRATAEQVEAALREQEQQPEGRRQRLGRLLLAAGAIDETDLVTALAEVHRLPLVELDRTDIDPGVARLIPLSVASRYRLMPLRWEGSALHVAVSDPIDVVAMDDVRALTGASGLALSLAAPSDIEARLNDLWFEHGTQEVVDGFARVVGAGGSSRSPVTDLAAEAAASTLVDRLLLHAIHLRATEIHLAPEPTGIRVQLRVDGASRDVFHVPAEGHRHVLGRLQSLTGMGPRRAGLPQDGRTRIETDETAVDIRVDVLPSLYGETVCIRLYPVALEFDSLDAIGLTADQVAAVQAVTGPGLVLVVGPARSGRSTTAAVIAAGLTRTSGRVISVAEPVGIAIPGVVHVPVDPATGMTMATAVAAALEQQPDVLTIDGINDPETARLAVEAARHRCLVVATMAAPDAAAVVERTMALGVHCGALATVLRCAIAQRLVRRPCPVCAAHGPAEEDEVAALAADRLGLTGDDMAAEHLITVGCARCGWTGFSGRIGIVEVMPVDESLRELIAVGASPSLLRDDLRERGHHTLTDAARARVRADDTTMVEAAEALADLPAR